jgi:hypoxanthine phosphoribosyltransferase
MVERTIGKVVYHHHEIEKRIPALAGEVHTHYGAQGVDVVHAIRLLRGGKRFGGEFVEALRKIGGIEVDLQDAHVESYEDQKSTGRVKVHFDVPDEYVLGHHLLVLDDVVDTALTATWAIRNYERRGAADVLFVPLIDKPQGRDGIDFVPHFLGFQYHGAMYLEGYGMQDRRDVRMDDIVEVPPK